MNDPHESATWVYNYDRGGNITSKVRYAYTTGTLGTAQQTIPYTYGDSNWKDKLTAYNGQTISYDVIGNPTNDGTWTYTWQHGRQLKQMSKTGTTVEFKYDHNGLRIQKIVNEVETNYTLHGKLISHLTCGIDKLHFFYDAQSKPAKVEYNDAMYTYVHNLQGDIVGIIDSNGTLVVEYKYDAWGKPLSTTGSMAATLGKVNPFRYRGYVYDEEIGLYVLESRVYSPELCRFIISDDAFALLSFADDHESKNIYSYCDNNPLVRKDEDGNWWQLIGAAVGGLISGGMEVIAQLKSGTSISDINLKKVGVATVSGAVSGFVASTGIGLLGQMGLNAAISTASYVADETLNDGTITVKGVVANAAAGAISGLIGGRGANTNKMRTVWTAANKGITRERRRRNIEYATKQIARHAAKKASIRTSVVVSTVRYTVGGYAARRYARWRISLR